MKRSGLVILVTVAACSDAATSGGMMDALAADVPFGVLADARTLPDANGPVTFDPCVESPKPGYDPVAAGLAGCCTGVGPAHCVHTNEILPALVAQLTPCDDGISVCMPDPIIHAGGQYVPATCTSSLVNMPGACLSKCIPLVANNPQTALLSQDGCGDGELCIPCKNPLNGEDTGACNLIELLCPVGPGTPDAGPTQCPYTGPPIIDPGTLPACSPACGGAHCVPAALVPDAQKGLLQACTATGGGAGLCAPDRLIETGGNFVPTTCASIGGSEGRCLSTCLPDVAAKALILPQDVCPDEELCVPCFDPTSDNASTGACNIACDSPKQPPLELTCPWTGPDLIDPDFLPGCDCGAAHCLPEALVPADLRPLLGACAGGFCVPDPLIRTGGNYIPPTCASVAGAEGRCLSTCLPPIAAQTLLPRSTCGAGEKCVPCFDPLTGDGTTPTGACTIASCDAPADPPLQITCPWTGPPVIDPAILPSCAGGACTNAHCLPAQYVPPAQQSQLAHCSGGTSFCAPDPIIATAGNYVPPNCFAFAGTAAEGRCLSSCLPAVAGQASLEQSSCAGGNKCAPCYDPFTGADTGACRTASCDAPDPGPGYRFPNCCFFEGQPQGRCIPTSQIPDGDEGNLQVDACPAGPYLCVPAEQLPGGQGQGCRAVTIVPPFFYDGTCLSDCLDLGLGTIYPQANCPGHHTCIPCFLAPDGSPGC